MATIQDIQDQLNQMGFNPDQDEYFGINVDSSDDGDFYVAYNNPGMTNFYDLDTTLANLQGFDVDDLDTEDTIWNCFV